MRGVTSSISPGSPGGDTLVVLLHGCTWASWQRGTQLRHVADAVREAMPRADLLMPVMPIEFWSVQEPDRIVAGTLAAVDEAWETRAAAGKPYQRVVMIGFSFGSVLVRRLYCSAAGARADATIDVTAARPWAARVERVVLLAGLNRGWTTESPVSRIESAWNSVGTAIGHLLPKKPTIFSIRRGAPFLTLMRLQWLALESAGMTPPLTVQLLGTRDDIVSPADNIDLATGERFVYIEVPQSGHFDVVAMSGRTTVEAQRRTLFQQALTGSRDALAPVAVTGAELLQLLPAEAGARGELVTRSGAGLSPTDVVFVVHGIRDKGYWTRKIARVVVTCGRAKARDVVAVAPSYGYFAMLPFLLPWTRRAKVEWLLDHYVTIRASHPRARISFVGHSNGTYVLAGAVDSCPAVTFGNVVFAGSVVRSDFDWRRCIQSRQVSRVLNYVATTDWVVAIFPRLLGVLRLQDLGGAGHDGFDQRPEVTDVEYVPGRHSAALDEQHWNDIAAFVLDGSAPTAAATVRRRSLWVVAAGHAAGLIWLLIFAAASVPIYCLLTLLGFPEITGSTAYRDWQLSVMASVPPWLLAGMLMGWSRLVATVVMRL